MVIFFSFLAFIDTFPNVCWLCFQFFDFLFFFVIKFFEKLVTANELQMGLSEASYQRFLSSDWRI